MVEFRETVILNRYKKYKYVYEKKTIVIIIIQGRIQVFVQGGLNFFLSREGLSNPLGPENSMKSIDLPGSGGA